MKNQLQNLQKQNKQEAWTTMEMLITFPLLISAFVLTIYFGQLMFTKITLTNATNAAVQVLAKTKDCGIADSYFSANFSTGGAITSCSAGNEVSEYSATYEYSDIPLMMVVLPSTHLSSSSKAVTEKQD